MATTSRYLAIDMGAGSGRAMEGRIDRHGLHLQELSRFPNPMLPMAGHLHWDMPGIFAQTLEALRLAQRQSDVPLTSMGIDTWGVDFGLLAADGSLLGLPCTYRDSRTDGIMQRMFEQIPKEEIYKLTGIQFLPFNSLYQLAAMVWNNAPQLKLATDLLFIPDLLHYWLTGRKATEFSFATTSQMFNPLTMDWEPRLLEGLGVSRDLLQPVIMPGERVGTISDDVCRQAGITPVPVCAVATHDTGSAVAAVPATGDDWVYISSGTWSLMGFESPTPVITPQGFAGNITNEGGVGGSFRVLRNITGMWLLERYRDTLAGPPDYDSMMDMCMAAPPFASLIDPDHPSFLHPPDMAEAIADFCRKTDQPVPQSIGSTVRCILESLALKYRWVLQRLETLAGRSFKTIHIIGGGSRNRVLCRLTADIAGLPVVAGPVEATAMGNLMVQAMAAGDIESLEEGRALIRRTVTPLVYEPHPIDYTDCACSRFDDLVYTGE